MPQYLPLFPLDVVLFPQMALPLHIFEERYKEMIGYCLQEQSPFGVLYAHDERIETVGCSADISHVIKRYQDGRIDLIALGQKRFRVISFDSEKSYLRGSIELLPDSEEGQEPSERQAKQALALFDQASQLMGSQGSDEFNRESSLQGLAFRLAAALELENDIRQRILEAQSDDDRLEELTRHLSQLIPRLVEKDKSARRASSNGRLH